jgi:hypothetical protein
MIIKAHVMFDLSKIINGLPDLKDTIEKNRIKNLRAELAGQFLRHKDFFIRDLNDGQKKTICDEAVEIADALLKALGETK